MFNKIEIPSPEDIMNGPEVKAYRKKEFNKAVKLIAEQLRKEFVGTNYVQIHIWDCPVAVIPEVIKAYKDKGWKIVKEEYRSSTYCFGLPSMKTPRKFNGFTHEDLGAFVEL